MDCPRCGEQPTTFRWKRNSPMPYSIECKKCGKFIKWSTGGEWNVEYVRHPSSEMVHKPGQHVDVSDLFK